MTDSDEEDIKELVDEALEEFGVTDDTDNIDPDYPPDFTPEDRVRHVLSNEYPQWKRLEWIRVASDTSREDCKSVVKEMLSEGQVEISVDGIRKNRFYIACEQVKDITGKASEDPGWL